MKAYKIEAFTPPEGETREEIEVKGPFQIQGPDSADWALDKLGRYQQRIAEIERQAEAARAMIESRRVSLVASLGQQVAYFEALLLDYAQRARSEIVGGSRKSRDYLHGRIGFRSKGGRLVVKDAAALAAWLETQPPEAGLYRVKLDPDKKALDAHFEATNELPPGCEYEPATESISIDPVEFPQLKEIP